MGKFPLDYHGMTQHLNWKHFASGTALSGLRFACFSLRLLSLYSLVLAVLLYSLLSALLNIATKRHQLQQPTMPSFPPPPSNTLDWANIGFQMREGKPVKTISPLFPG